jgi:circadian clock protein KaiB
MAAKKVVKKVKKRPTGAVPPNGDGWNLRLYVAGDSPRSRSALANLRKLCEARLKNNYHIEVIDLTKRPDLAKADQILAVPTLIRKVPEPMKRIIGDLSNADRALVALEMQALAAGEGA